MDTFSKLDECQEIFFVKIVETLPSNVVENLKINSLTKSQKIYIFMGTSSLLIWNLYYFLCVFPGILSFIFSLYPVNITIKYVSSNSFTSNKDNIQVKVLLSWLFYNFMQNSRIILDSFPLMRMSAHVVFIYNLSDDERNLKLLTNLAIKYNSYLSLLKSKLKSIRNIENRTQEIDETQ